jgi:hypothetical protein
MHEHRKYSRRTLAFGLFAMPVSSVLPTIAETELNPSDVELLALGRELFSIQAALDHAGEHDQTIALLERIDVVTTAIADIPATTIQELRFGALVESASSCRSRNRSDFNWLSIPARHFNGFRASFFRRW